MKKSIKKLLALTLTGAFLVGALTDRKSVV